MICRFFYSTWKKKKTSSFNVENSPNSFLKIYAISICFIFFLNCFCFLFIFTSLPLCIYSLLNSLENRISGLSEIPLQLGISLNLINIILRYHSILDLKKKKHWKNNLKKVCKLVFFFFLNSKRTTITKNRGKKCTICIEFIRGLWPEIMFILWKI